jgi:hypothetical protein
MRWSLAKWGSPEQLARNEWAFMQEVSMETYRRSVNVDDLGHISLQLELKPWSVVSVQKS